MRCAIPLLSLVLLSLAWAMPGAGQPVSLPNVEAEEAAAPSPVPEGLASPRATMATFLEAMNALFERPTAWDDAFACLDLDVVPRASWQGRARQLYAVLNRIEEVEPDRLPGSSAVEQGLTVHRYFPDRRRDRALLSRIGPPAGGITLRDDGTGRFRFDAATLASLDALHEQMASQPLVAGEDILTVSDWLEARLPDSLVGSSVLGVRSWQWLAVFLVILAGLLVDLLVLGALRVACARAVRRLPSETPSEDLRRSLRPIGLVAASLVWLLLFRFVGLEGGAVPILEGALQIFLVLAATVSAWRLIDLVAEVLADRAATTDTKIDDVLVPLVTRAVKIFVVVMGVIYAADALDIPITPLLASLTVAGVGFSFAAKDTVENFFGSVAVLLDRPFEIGDWVVIDGAEGIVEQVGFRSTRVRTFYNSQITVPNANLVRARVDNYGRRRYRRWKTTVGLQYDTPPDKLLAFSEGVRELVRAHPYTRKDYYEVYANDFGPSSLDILVYVFFDVPDWSTELRERERLLVDMVRLADRLGVSFAFPTQTLHVFGGEAVEPGLHEPPGAGSDETASRAGIRAARELVRRQSWQRERPGPVRFSTGPSEPLDAAGNPVEVEPSLEPPVPEDGADAEDAENGENENENGPPRG